MELDGLQLSVTRVRCSLPVARRLQFSPNSSVLVIVTHEGAVHLVKLDAENAPVLNVLEPPPGYIARFCFQDICFVVFHVRLNA